MPEYFTTLSKQREQRTYLSDQTLLFHLSSCPILLNHVHFIAFIFHFVFKSKYKRKTITLRKKISKKARGWLSFYKHFPETLEKSNCFVVRLTSQVRSFWPSSPRMRLATVVGEDAAGDWQRSKRLKIKLRTRSKPSNSASATSLQNQVSGINLTSISARLR